LRGPRRHDVSPQTRTPTRQEPYAQHFALLLQQFFSFAGDPQRSRVDQLTLQPFVTKLLPDSWYVQTQPVITLVGTEVEPN